MTRRINPWLALAISVLLVAAVAFFGSQFMPGPWYEALAKPAWNPPNWLFGPAWTTLYALMALAAWKVWIAVRRIDIALVLYAVQLVLNAMWSWLFFGLERIDLALLDIVALLALVLATTVLFWKRDRLAGMLMVPYVLWLGFATALNLAIWQLNA